VAKVCPSVFLPPHCGHATSEVALREKKPDPIQSELREI